jgi:hypothetical protein
MENTAETVLPVTGHYALNPPAHPVKGDGFTSAGPDDCKWVIRFSLRSTSQSDADVHVHVPGGGGSPVVVGGWAYSGDAAYWWAMAECWAWWENHAPSMSFDANMPEIVLRWEIEAEKLEECGTSFVWTQAASVIEANAERQLTPGGASSASARAYAARKITCQQVGLDWEHAYGAEVPIPAGGGQTSVTLGGVGFQLESGDTTAGDVKKGYSPSASANVGFARWDMMVGVKVRSTAATAQNETDLVEARSAASAREAWIAIQLVCEGPGCNFYRNYIIEVSPSHGAPLVRRIG